MVVSLNSRLESDEEEEKGRDDVRGEVDGRLAAQDGNAVVLRGRGSWFEVGVLCLGFRVGGDDVRGCLAAQNWDAVLWVRGSGFAAWGLGFTVRGLEFRLEGRGLRVKGSGFRV